MATRGIKPIGDAKLIYDGKTLTLPVIEGTEGERALDIAQLRKETGLVAYDPGYVNTGSCQSGITFLNGEEGILRYCGYPIEELAEKSTFLEVAYLLLHGSLPTQSQCEDFEDAVTQHKMIHEDLRQIYQALPKDSHPMAICGAVIGTLSAFYKDMVSPQDKAQVDEAAVRVIAKLPTIAAYSYKHSTGQPFMYPLDRNGYAANFLHMMFATPCSDYEVDAIEARALDLLLILHADHEQNCSTSTVRLVGSSQANIFASVSSGINALWGPLHGGANQAVIEMLEAIHEGEDSVETFVSKVKDKKSKVRLMGFGHRVYKNFDPRAQILKSTCGKVLKVLEKTGGSNPLFEIAQTLEEIALRDDYFISRRLYPNVDFYSGIIYRALGIPTNMFTVMFAIGRLPGWIAQWMEMQRDPDLRIGRPRQIYTGEPMRKYIPIDRR